MSSNSAPKKRVVVSYKNLSPELLELVKEKYPYGFADHMIRIDRSPADFFYAIVLETADASYLVKVDVKVDTGAEEEEEKEYYDDEIKDAGQIADDSSDVDDSDDD